MKKITWIFTLKGNYKITTRMRSFEKQGNCLENQEPWQNYVYCSPTVYIYRREL